MKTTDCCEEANKNWNIQKLFDDLENKQKFLYGDVVLGNFERQYLCLLLSGKNQNEIAEELRFSVESIRVKLADKKKPGLYRVVERLTHGRIENWRDMIILLVNKGYRRHPEKDNSHDKKNIIKQATVIIKFDAELSEDLLKQLEKNMKDILGANKLMIHQIEKGCIEIYWKGSQAACEEIETLFREGVLAERLGVPILNARVVTKTEKVSLGQWFQDTFETGWRVVEELLTPQQLSFGVTLSQQVKRGKLIDLRADLISHAVVLVINLSKIDEDKVVVNLKVYPSEEDSYLPPDLKLLVLIGEDEVFQEVTARSTDLWIQSEFDADIGDEFKVKLVLGDAMITETFVI